MRFLRRILLSLLFLTALCAAQSGIHACAQLASPNCEPIQGIAVTATPQSITVGSASTLSAQYMLAGNTPNTFLTNYCLWASSNTAIATVGQNSNGIWVANGISGGTATISCTPAGANTQGLIGSVTLTVAASGSPQITNPANCSGTCFLPSGTNGTAYSFTFTATGGTAPYTWSKSAGSFPTGLSINGSTGALTGTPSVNGTFTATVLVTDNVAATASVNISITIMPAANLGASLPTQWVDNNELTCGWGTWAACASGSPGLSLTAPTYTLTLSLTAASVWSPSRPAACASGGHLAHETFTIGGSPSYWPVNPLPTDLGTGRLGYLADIEACRSTNGANYGIVVVRPPGKYVTSSGVVIQQTANSQASTPLVEMTTGDANLRAMPNSAGSTMCDGGVGDNTATGPKPGLNNPTCDGQNMYYALAPSNTVVSDAGSSDYNYDGILGGITTLSVNTITLAPIVHSQGQSNVYGGVIPLMHGYVSPGTNVLIKDSHGAWHGFTAADTASGCPQGFLTGPSFHPNTTGVCIGNLNGDLQIPAGSPVCYNTNTGRCAGSGSGSGVFTLANGQAHNISDYNYLQYLAEDICTANACQPLQFCNPLQSGKGQCTGQIAPDHWFMADFAPHFCSRLDPATPTCTQETNGQYLILTGVGSSQITDPAKQLAAHLHLRRFWAPGDWWSLAVGNTSSPTAVQFSAVNYSSAGDFAVSGCLSPGGESHAALPSGNAIKLYNFWAEGCSSGVFAGGASNTYALPTYEGFYNLEQRIYRETFPYSWLGENCQLYAGVGKNNGNGSGNACGNIPDINPYWGGAGDNYPLSVTQNNGDIQPTACTGTPPPGVTCVNVSTTGVVTYITGPQFHDSSSAWGTSLGKRTVFINGARNNCGSAQNQACKLQTLGTGTCPTYLNGFTGAGCPTTLTINYSGAALTNVPFVFNGQGIVRKNCEETKEGLLIVRSGGICENVDNSGGQGGILQSHSLRQCSGGCSGQNYNIQIAHWNDIAQIQRNGCLGPSWDGRSAGVSNGGGASRVMQFMSALDQLIYNVSANNPGCPASDALYRQFSAEQQWVGSLVCAAGACTFTGAASVDGGIALSKVVGTATNGACATGFSGTCTIYDTGNAANASSSTLQNLCGNGYSTPTGAYLMTQGFTTAGNNSTNTTGFKCLATTAPASGVDGTMTLANASGATDSTTGNAYPVVNLQCVGTDGTIGGAGCSSPNNGMCAAGVAAPCYVSSVIGYETFDVLAGSPAVVRNCSNSNLNTSTTSVGPPLTAGTKSWTGPTGWSIANDMTVTWAYSVTGTESDGLCTFDNTQGSPENWQQNHVTGITDACSPIGVGPAAGGHSAWAHMINQLNENSIYVSGTSCAVGTGGYYNPSTGISAPKEGTNSELNNTDAAASTNTGYSTNGSFSFFYNVFSRPGGAAADYTEYGNNPNYPNPGGHACTGAGCSPPYTIYFPPTPYGTGSSGIGFVGLKNASQLNINLADYHNWALDSSSLYRAGASSPAADATDMGARIGNIDTRMSEQTFSCPVTCASPGPFPN